MYVKCFSIDREWKSLTEEGQILLETDVSSVKDFTKHLQDKAELIRHICSAELMNLMCFLIMWYVRDFNSSNIVYWIILRCS